MFGTLIHQNTPIMNCLECGQFDQPSDANLLRRMYLFNHFTTFLKDYRHLNFQFYVYLIDSTNVLFNFNLYIVHGLNLSSPSSIQ